jgi:two-component system NtrC family sensor kinase
MRAVEKGNTEKLKADLDVLYNHTKRIGQITGDLLVFSRMKSSECEAIDLNEIVKRIVRLVEPPIHRKGIELKMDLAENLPPVWGSEMGIDQVVYNILYNAYQATDAKGTVSLRTSLNYEGRIEIKIADNGQGISSEIMKRIFEPFFTTKEVGQGTGLGLSLSYGIIQEFGGTINVDSEPGKGTLFTVTLDAAEERKAGGKKSVTSMDAGRDG